LVVGRVGKIEADSAKACVNLVNATGATLLVEFACLWHNLVRPGSWPDKWC
jgi:hypothetical protein